MILLFIFKFVSTAQSCAKMPKFETTFYFPRTLMHADYIWLTLLASSSQFSIGEWKFALFNRPSYKHGPMGR